MPCLRKLNMSFLVYNPLAGGLLTGKHHGGAGGGALEGGGDGDGNTSSGSRGRFVGNAMYQDRFWKPEYFEAGPYCLTVSPTFHLNVSCFVTEIPPNSSRKRCLCLDPESGQVKALLRGGGQDTGRVRRSRPGPGWRQHLAIPHHFLNSTSADVSSEVHVTTQLSL